MLVIYILGWNTTCFGQERIQNILTENLFHQLEITSVVIRNQQTLTTDYKFGVVRFFCGCYFGFFVYWSVFLGFVLLGLHLRKTMLWLLWSTTVQKVTKQNKKSHFAENNIQIQNSKQRFKSQNHVKKIFSIYI